MANEKVYLKDPAAILDYAFDWSTWLTSGDSIVSATVVAETGLTVDSSAASGTAVTAWLSDGEPGDLYGVTCQVVTPAGRVDERTMLIEVVQR